jgi:hypothetical protein
VYFLRKKSKVFEHLKDFKTHAKKQSKKMIKILRIYNEGAYVKNGVQNLCDEASIQLQYKFPYTLQHKGVAKKKNRSFKKMETCMLHAKSLPSKILVEAINLPRTYKKNLLTNM